MIHLYIYNSYDMVDKVFTGTPKKPVIISHTLPDSDYTINEHLDCLKKYSHRFSDYLQYRDAVKNILNIKTWTGLDDYEKQDVIDLHLKEDAKSYEDSDTEKGVFLMSEGVSLEDVPHELKHSYTVHHLKDKEACFSRGECLEIYEVILTYLSPLDAVTFYDVATTLIERWKSEGLKGLNDYSSKKGLFDWVESTNGYESFGLSGQGFTYIKGDEAEFIEKFMEIARLGYYES